MVLQRFVSILLLFATVILSPRTAEARVLSPEKKITKFTPNLPKGYKGQIQLSGAFALYPMAVRWAEEFRKVYPNIRIDISAGGAGKGITDALTHMVDIGMVSRDIYPQEIEKGVVHFTVVRDAIVLTVNAKNPLIDVILKKGIKRSTAIKMWKEGSIRRWGECLGTDSRIPIHIYSRSDACGAGETFASWIGVKQEDLEGTAVFGDPGITSIIQRDKVGIGYNNMAYAYDLITKHPYNNVLVCPIDLNENGVIDRNENFYKTSTDLMKAVADGRYPAPPARDLYFVTGGVPKRAEVVEFIRFILTKGQKYAHEVAFVSLTQKEIEKELLKLK